jgi:hypothetical protein
MYFHQTFYRLSAYLFKQVYVRVHDKNNYFDWDGLNIKYNGHFHVTAILFQSISHTSTLPEK